MSHSKFFRKFIKSVEGYSDYSYQNVNFSNFEEKLKKLDDSNDYNDIISLNNDLNNSISNLRNNIENTKSRTVSDEDNKNKLLRFLGVKQVELYTNSENIIKEIGTRSNDDKEQSDKSLLSNEKRSMHSNDMIRNKIQKNLLLFLVILLCFLIIIINP
tara:strand:+ start:1064 stop:1537 length:474 start_codon:yes stop_codon:yes gene_type:complete